MLKKSKLDRAVWIDTTITLLALELMSYFYYGARALVLGGICVAVSSVAEFVSLRLMGKRFSADDLACSSDALIIALLLPVVMDYRIAAIACLFAVGVAKNVFGGRKNMIFSPAAAAYVFVLTSWGRKLLTYPAPHVKTGIFSEPEGLSRSASYIYDSTGKFEASDFEILLGNFAGPAGAASVLLLIISAVMLILRRDISAGAFVGSILGTAVFAWIVPASGTRTESVKYSLVLNVVLFASIYIVADRRIAPKREYFAFFYGFFIAAASYVIILTTARENAIVIVSLLFTPASLALKELEKKIDSLYKKDVAEAEIYEAFSAPAETIKAIPESEKAVSSVAPPRRPKEEE